MGDLTLDPTVLRFLGCSHSPWPLDTSLWSCSSKGDCGPFCSTEQIWDEAVTFPWPCKGREPTSSYPPLSFRFRVMDSFRVSVSPVKWKDYCFPALLRLNVFMHHVCAVGPVVWKPVTSQETWQDGHSLRGSCALRIEERHGKYGDKVGNVKRELKARRRSLRRGPKGWREGPQGPFLPLFSLLGVPFLVVTFCIS